MKKWNIGLLSAMLMCAALISRAALAVEVHHVPRTTVEKNILKALDRDFDFSYEQVPLSTVVSVLGEELKVPVVIDTAALDAVGVSSDMEVSLRLHGATVAAGLEMMLKEMDLYYLVTPRALVITSRDEADSIPFVRVYDVSAIAGLGFSTTRNSESADLREASSSSGSVAKLVKTFVFPELDAPKAAPAQVAENANRRAVMFASYEYTEDAPCVGTFGDLLVVKGSASQHKSVCDLLSQVYAGQNPEEEADTVLSAEPPVVSEPTVKTSPAGTPAVK